MRKPLLLLAAVLAAAPARAEVSVDRLPDGAVQLFFEPGSAGPWGPVRSDVPLNDVLNVQGDASSDGYPTIRVNPVTQRPEATWATAGDEGEIKMSWHDGTGWVAPLNLSEHAGADFGPGLGHDEWGNRFVAWSNARSEHAAVLFAGVRADGTEWTEPRELTARQRDARHPSMAVHDDGDVYVAYEEDPNGNDVVPSVAIDRLVPTRDAGNGLYCSGENSVDLSRSQTIRTAISEPNLVADVRVHSEGGHVWVDWVDSAGRLGWVELMTPGAFSPAAYRSYDISMGDQAARDLVRTDVLAP